MRSHPVYRKATVPGSQEFNAFNATVKFKCAGRLLLLAQHKPAAALTEFSSEQFVDFRLAGIPLALDKLGRREEADKILAQELSRDSAVHGAAYQIALVYANRGDADSAFQWLERGVQQRDAGMLWMKYDPILRPLSHDPRFKTILNEMHQS